MEYAQVFIDNPRRTIFYDYRVRNMKQMIDLP
jgi:hypothetical protein